MTDSSSTPTQAPADDIPEQVKVRAAKRARLMEAGIPAYPVRLPITTTIKAVREKYAHLEAGEETEDYVGLAGRVILARNGGKLCFATLMDGEGNKIQVCSPPPPSARSPWLPTRTTSTWAITSSSTAA